MSTFRVPQDVADRNALRQMAQRVYLSKRDEGKSASLAWAEVDEIVHQAVGAYAMEDIARIRQADAKRAADIERSKQ